MTYSISRSRFLQRMLKKSDDESDDEGVKLGDATIRTECSSRKKSWNRQKSRDSYSPCRNNSTQSVKSPPRPITLNFGEPRNDHRRRNLPETMTRTNTADGEETPNIERIRREFEMGFLSPTKQEAPEISTRSGRFVKKIVAAFEEKYKNFNDTKVEIKKYPQRESVSSSNSSFDEDKTMAEMVEESMALIDDDECAIESLESRLIRYLDSYVAAAPVCEEETQRSDVEEEEEVSLDPEEGDSLGMAEGSSPSRKNASFSWNTSRLGTSDKSVVDKETSVKTASKAASKNLVRTDSSLKRERKPKIVGAYLKKPIEVEDTSVDWIPILGKSLPRKKSFKRLLSILTGKKSADKSPKLYSSEIDLQDETTKELLQDSGYDENSGSSSSLVSLASVNEVLLLQQKNHEFTTFDDDYRIPKMTTFQRPRASSDLEEGFGDDRTYRSYREDDSNSTNDAASETCSVSSKKLFLEEVSRSELRLSLGPAFPSAIGAKVVCSLGRREATNKATSKNWKNTWSIFDDFESSAPPLPKHPFVSADSETLDDPAGSSDVLPDPIDDRLDLGFCESDKCPSPSSFRAWTFPTEEIAYDVPRRYFSKSEPGLVSIGKERSLGGSPTENVYDVPRVKIPRRPRSSIYEDALSLKRRNEIFPSSSPALPNDLYGFPCHDDPQYATVKPRNTRIYRSKELLRSMGDLNSNDVNHTDYYYCRYDNEGIPV